MSIQQSKIWQLHLSWELRQEPYYLSGQEYSTNRAHCLRECRALSLSYTKKYWLLDKSTYVLAVCTRAFFARNYGWSFHMKLVYAAPEMCASHIVAAPVL